MLNNWLCKKGLVVGIIVLFIGASVSSAISIDTKSSISNNQSEECKECNEVSDADLIKVERLLDRVEVYSKSLLVLSKHHPELSEISEELSNQLSNINKLYDEFNTDILQQGKHLICFILEPLYFIIFVIWAFAYEGLQYALIEGNVILFIMFLSILMAVIPILESLTILMVKYECDSPFLEY